MRMKLLVLGIALGLPGIAAAQTGFSITGSMSNFDCGNHCDDPCDEFEIEIEDCHPEDIVHCYRNGNYGSPTITLRGDGLATIVDYRNPQHSTAINAIEHFGISMRQMTSTNVVRVRWMRQGRPATVNGMIPIPGGGTAPATQPMLPSINAETGFGAVGESNVSLSVTNNDPVQAIWVKRRALIAGGNVTLEALMPNDPVVTTTTVLDASPIFLPAGETLTISSDLIEVEDNQSAVFAAQYYQDLASGGIFNNGHIRGPELGNIMTASIASPDAGCDVSAPVITLQPVSATAAMGHSADLRVGADGNDLTLSYQWLREGQPLSDGGLFHGVSSDELSIDEVTDATEGLYSVRITNICGTITSDSALVFVDGHNNPPPRLGVCIGDFNNSGGQPTVQDIFDYLAAYFNGDVNADVNASGSVTVQDVFDYLSAYFAGCV